MEIVHDTLPSRRLCGAKNRAGGPCGRPAGWGTPHVGEGRCKLHGGISGTLTHGRYSKLANTPLGEAVAKHEKDPDLLNMGPDLAMGRAILEDFVARYDLLTEAIIAWHVAGDPEGRGRPPRIPDVDRAIELLDKVTKIAERIEGVKSANAISWKDFLRLMHEMGVVVEDAVPEQETRERIRRGWNRIRL